MFHREYVVANLLSIASFGWCGLLTGFVSEELTHVCFGALDSRTQDCLEPQMWSDKQVRVWYQPADTSQSVDGPSSFVEQGCHVLR